MMSMGTYFFLSCPPTKTHMDAYPKFSKENHPKSCWISRGVALSENVFFLPANPPFSNTRSDTFSKHQANKKSKKLQAVTKFASGFPSMWQSSTLINRFTPWRSHTWPHQVTPQVQSQEAGSRSRLLGAVLGDLQ